MTEQDPVESLAADAERLRGPLERALGVRSRWNGVVEVAEVEGDAYALFRAGGAIAARPVLARRKMRWRTLLHELVHSVAAPLGREYEEQVGWEEGPVECVQRLVRPRVMAEAGVPFDAGHAERLESFWRYNPYVEAVESVRELLHEDDALRFCLDLLQVPVGQRRAVLLRRAAAQGRREAVGRISALSAALRTHIPAAPAAEEQRRLEEEEDDEPN